MNSLCYIGIDQNTHSSGIAAIDSYGKLLWVKVVKISKREIPDTQERSFQMANQLSMLCPSMHVAAIGIEKPIIAKGKVAALAMAKLYGMTFYACRMITAHVYDIEIGAGKNALTGSGRASKEDSVAAVKMQFGLDVSDDEADAIGVALRTRSKYIEEAVWDQALVGYGSLSAS